MSSAYSNSNCTLFVRRMQEKNISPMPIIGLYVALASLICTYGMMVNASFTITMSLCYRFSTFNIFGLNATWLTLLAVATKLTGDLTSPMWSYDDNISKISSTVFLTVAMAQFLTSLGSMNGTDMLTNLMALSILVFTIIVDLCIQLGTGVLDFSIFPEIILALVLLLCMFIVIVCSALAVPAIKKHAESKHQTLVKQMEAAVVEQHSLTRAEELRLSITKYWVMAVSGSPQFLITRLASFGFTYTIPLFSAFVISVLELISISRIPYDWITNCQKKQSDYKWSVELIVSFQSVSTTILPFCTIMTLLLFSVWSCEGNGIKIHREEFTVEPYWTEKLEEWKQVPIRMRIIKGKKVEKIVHDIKSLILTFCILLQTLVVIFIKFCCVVSFYVIWLPLLFLVTLLCKLLSPVHKVSNDQMREEIELSQQFVILLEGDEQLPKSLLRNIVGGLNKYIKGGKNRQPRSLLNLLKQSFFYKGAIQFDNSQVPSLLTEEPPNCWTFPVMTLTAIAVALPNIANQHVDELISSVDEGLQYASHIDILDGNRALKYTKNAASVVWVGVKLHKKWLDMDLGDTIREVHSSKEIIQGLADEAERIVKEFGSTGSKSLVENPLYWPPNVLAANSMYRISRTILLYYGNGECQPEELFRKLICMIANILAACLINLPHLIATKFINIAFEERLNSVGNAATLFGEIEDILKFFEERQLWGIGPSQPLYIDEWLRWMESGETQDPTALTSATNNGTSPTVESNDSNDELVIVPM